MYREKTIGIDRSVKKKKIPKSKGLVGACDTYGGKVSKIIDMGADTYLYFGIFFRNLYGLY